MQAGEWQETEDDDGSGSLEAGREKKGHDTGDSSGRIDCKGGDKAGEEGREEAGQESKGSDELTRAIRFKTPLHVSVFLGSI